MDKSKWGVHETHCCVLHGCKYGDEDCPVESGETEQEYICEDCDYDGIHTVEQVKEALIKDKVQSLIDSNACPYCGNTSGKKLIDTNGFSDDLWCHVCKGEYSIIYKRVPVNVILLNKSEDQDDEEEGEE